MFICHALNNYPWYQVSGAGQVFPIPLVVHASTFCVMCDYPTHSGVSAAIRIYLEKPNSKVQVTAYGWTQIFHRKLDGWTKQRNPLKMRQKNTENTD